MFVIVPAIDGVPQVGNVKLIQGVSISPTEAIAQIEGELQDGWIELTQAEFEAILPPIEPSVFETTEQKLSRLEEQNLILMDALATTFEEVMALRTLVEGGTE